MSNYLQSCEIQHARLSCPSLSPGVCSDSCPLTQWWHLTSSSSVIPLCCLLAFPASGSFQWICSSHQVVKVLELQLQHQSFQWIFRTDLLWGWLFWSLCSPGILKSLLQHHSSKTSILWCSGFFIFQLSHPYMTTGKTIALTRWTFVGKVMSLLFNMLSRLVITFLPRSKRLLISWLQ